MVRAGASPREGKSPPNSSRSGAYVLTLPTTSRNSSAGMEWVSVIKAAL